jgi:arylsulfatase A-like enzyme/Tfp pilus assembly protein PilF
VKVFASALVVAAAALAVWWWQRDPRFVLPAPGADANILVVTIDTLRADALGGGRAATPNLDRLAAHGARFTFAHAHHLLTLPSHATILTGRYPYAHGVRDNNGYRLAPSQVTIASRLKARGFATGAFVGAFPVERRFGLGAGFDVYDDRVGEVGSSANFSLTERRADEVVKAAVDWIGGQAGKWFGWVHLFDPHAPYRAPDEWRARYSSDPYAAEVAWTDAALGPLFERLAASARPTLVVVTADHGEALGDHDELTHGVFAYEATLRVPLIVAAITPGAARPPRGVVIDAPVRHVDLVPTFLDVAEAGPDGTLPGTTLRDLIARGDGPDRPAYFETWMTHLARGWAPLHGVLAGREKYIDLPIPELYDLAADPGESRNLIDTRPERVSVLRNLLRATAATTAQRPADESAEVKQRLRSLGYVGLTAAPARGRYTEQDDPKRLIVLDRRMHTAVEMFEGGRTDEAVTTLRGVIAERADNAEAYLNLAVVYWEAGRQQDAIHLLQEALARGLTQPEIRVKLGQCLALSGAGQRAIPLLETAPPDDVDALQALGLAYGQAGRRADALKAFGRVLEIAPSSGLAYANMATVHLAAGDYASADRDFRRALAIDPRLTGARTQLGVVLAATGRTAEAIDTWIQAASLDRDAFEALYNVTIACLQAGRHDAAREYGSRFLRDAPSARYSSQLAQIRDLLDRQRSQRR